MKHIRIGKDIAVRWTIFTNGEPTPLSDRDLTFFVHIPVSGTTQQKFAIEDNVVVFCIPGTDQRNVGIYGFTLWENYQKPGQTVVDCCSAFRLVSSSCMETGGDNSNITTASVDLTATLETGISGPIGHTPYVGPNSNWWVDGKDTGKPSRGPAPVKGIDYFTEAEVAQMVAEAAGQVPTPDVSGQIAEHNAAEDAHGDLRELLRGAVGLPAYDPQTYALTFTAQSGATVVVDLPLEVMGLDYDAATKEMIYTAADGTKRRISLADFVDIYIGSVGPEIQVTVDAGNVIRARLLDGSVGWAHLTTDLRSRIGSKVDAIPGKGLSANDYTDADKAEVAKIAALDEKTYTTTVNTPIWTLQPTIEGALNAAFVAHPEDFYFVTLRAADGEALPAGQFRLTPSLDAAYAADPAKAIDQTFTLAGLQTGNSGVLKESLPVDFLAVGEAWRMRSGGVTSVQINIEEQYRKDYDLSMVANIRPTRIVYAYYLPFGGCGAAYFTLSGVGSGYQASTGFLFRPNTLEYRKHNFSIETLHLHRMPDCWAAECARSLFAYNGTPSNRTELLNSPNYTTVMNGFCFSTDPTKSISELDLVNFGYQSGIYTLLNGSSIRITLKKR